MGDPASLGIDPPRCPSCSYLLLSLTEFRCPECGAPFDPEYIKDASFRAHLLPWERPEAGARVGRLGRTLVQASLHPGRFFASLSERKDRPITNAGMLIVACVLVSLCLHAAAFFVGRMAFFLGMHWRFGQPWQALDTVFSAIGHTWPTELILALTQVFWMLVSVMVIGFLIRLVSRGKLRALRAVDIAAAHSPAVAFGAFIWAFAAVVAAISQYTLIGATMFVGVFAPPVVLLLLVWCCCRRLLTLSRWKSVEMLVVAGVAVHWCGGAVSALLWKVQILLLGP